MRMTAKRRQAETAAAVEQLAPSKGPTRRQLQATRNTISANLAADLTDPLNPRSSAAAKIRKLAELDEALA